MTRILVLHYSSYGPIDAMAMAVAEGAAQARAHADVRRVPELVPEEAARSGHDRRDRPAPLATVT